MKRWGDCAQPGALPSATSKRGESGMRENEGTGPTARRPSRLFTLGGLVIALVALLGITAGSSLAKPTGKSTLRHVAATPVLTAKQHEGQRRHGTSTSGSITQSKEGDATA